MLINQKEQNCFNRFHPIDKFEDEYNSTEELIAKQSPVKELPISDKFFKEQRYFSL